MTLVAQIASLATRTGQEIKAVRSELTTGLSGKANSSHTHPATDISNSTATGRGVLTAATPTDARAAIGAGTSDLALGTTGTTAKAGNYVPDWAEITNKPGTFTPAAHSHVIGDVTNLQATLDAKLALAGGTLTDAANIAVGTTTGTKIGTATTQKLGFYNATPVVQQTATTDLGTALSNLGLRAAGTAYPITTSGAVSLTGTVTTTRRVKTPAALTAATTLTTTSNEIQTADATTAAFTINLPASATNGMHFTIKKIDSSANAVTITAVTTPLLDGATSIVLTRQHESVTLMATATNGTWRVINRLQSVESLLGTTATGQSLMSAADAAAARTAIGAGTSSLVLGTTAGTAKAGDYAPAWGDVTGKPTTFAPIIGSGATEAVAGNDPRLSDARTPTAHSHPATGISDSTATGRAVITAADASAARTAIGAGTSNLAVGTGAGDAKAGNYVPDWTEITSKPATFAPSAHTHVAANITDLSKSSVGLGNVDNTSDANKPVSTATQTALNGKLTRDTTATNSVYGTAAADEQVMLTWDTASGGWTIARRDANGRLKAADGVAADDVVTKGQLDLKAPIASPTFTGTVSGITKAMVGLGSVDNTADSAKNVLSATKLTTARNINGVSFDGTADITISASVADNSITNAKVASNAAIDPTKLGTGRVIAVDATGTPINITQMYLTQAQYDAIATKDQYTEYNIIA